MASWNNVTKTEQGLALEQKLLIQAKPLRLVAARSGAGKVNPTQLAKQTAVSDPKQTLELRPVYLSEENTATIPVMLSNAGLAEGYTLNQVGIYAEDPDGGEVLYIIAQTDMTSGESVPSASESVGYSIDWNIAVKVSEASSIEVVVNEAGKLTLAQADALYVRTETLDILLDDKVDKEDGKDLSSNDYTNEDKEKVSKLPADTIAVLEGKASKSVTVLTTLAASTWNQTDKTYSFETEYPAESFDLSVEPDSSCTEAQLDAWSGARIVGSSAGNVLKAYGDVPGVDIPVILEVKKK